MDQIKKFLIKLGSKERLKTDSVIEKILNRDFTYLDIKKLKGEKDIFRACFFIGGVKWY